MKTNEHEVHQMIVMASAIIQAHKEGVEEGRALGRQEVMDELNEKNKTSTTPKATAGQHEWLKITITKLLDDGTRKDDARKLLSPYAAAFIHGRETKMSVDEFNATCETCVAASTYMRWMNPVFFDGEINFTSADLNCYTEEFRNMGTQIANGEKK